MSRISPSYVTGLEKYINELLNQVSSLKAELREICAAIDDPACDLTLTAAECIKKLKVENESLKLDAERKTNGNRKIRDLVDGLLAQAGYAPDSSARHNLSLMNFDAAMAKGEQG